MTRNDIIDSLEQDIEDLKGLIEYEKYSTSDDLIKKQAKAVLKNLQEHLGEFIGNN